MEHCSKCGSEIADGAAFCTNCGAQIKIKKIDKINLPTVSNKILFIISASLLTGAAFSFVLIRRILLGFGLFHMMRYTHEQLILSAVAAFIGGIAFMLLMIFYKKGKILNEKHPSNILTVIFSFSAAYEIFAFILQFVPIESGMRLHNLFMWSDYINDALGTLFIITVLLICLVNNSKSGTIIGTVSLIFFYFFNFFDLSAFKYGYLFDLNQSDFDPSYGKASAVYSIILLFAPLAILVIGYACKLFFNEKTADTVIIALTAVITLLTLLNSIEVFQSVYMIAAGLFMLSLKPEKNSDNNSFEECKPKVKKTLKLSAAGVSSLIISAVIFCVVSGFISANRIKSSLGYCTARLNSPDSLTETDWENMKDILFGTKEYTLTPEFISKWDLASYRSIDKSINTMQSITKCFNYANNGAKLTGDLAEAYDSLKFYVDETWENDSILAVYYDKYVKMLPSADKIKVTGNYSNGKLTFTVANNNPVPIESCEVKFNFEFTYFDKFNDVEKHNGSETYTVEDIDGRDSKQQTVVIDPDDYYDSYWSYNFSYISNMECNIISVK